MGIVEGYTCDTFDIIENITIIECATSPVDTDALWLKTKSINGKTYTLVITYCSYNYSFKYFVAT